MINIVICDDEKSYQEILEFKIKKIFSDELNLEYQIDYVSSLEDLENFIESKRVEIVFLDIMVNESNSIDWLIKRTGKAFNAVVDNIDVAIKNEDGDITNIVELKSKIVKYI